MSNTINYSIYEQHQSNQSTYVDTRARENGEFDATAVTANSTAVNNFVNGSVHSSITTNGSLTMDSRLLQQQQPPPLPPPPSSAGNNQQPPIPPPLPHQSSLMMMNGSNQPHTLGQLSDQMSLLSGEYKRTHTHINIQIERTP